ncbi:hypothetical protein F2Q68_00015809 [Brassica cretica]|uniref:Uncharacterized protein n=2 Tax=Brassica cretica TaxID=69181 RepID=A0ABQ7EV49_BRACR|nr:hypothetical protein F2Q68_00015809 [Brassica cretica]KAF3607417.1 hypothetical protein DY000_02048372 [Brassica cretica]
MEEMRQDIARLQTHRAAEATTPASIDINITPSIDNDPSQPNPTKAKQDSYTRAEIDQMVEEVYDTLGASEDRLDRRCDDIYFPWDITISSLTYQTKAMQREIVVIQRYIASRPEASTSIDRRIKISSDNHSKTSIDEATLTDRRELVTKIEEDREYNCNNERQMAQRRRGNERLHCTKILKWINMSTMLHLLRMFEGTKPDLKPNTTQLCLSWSLVYMGSDSSNKSER